MMTIARRQLAEGLLDAKFIFMATIILVAFIINGYVYSGQYAVELSDWEDSLHTSLTLLEQQSDSLQQLSAYQQTVMRPPSALAFIREAGDQLLINTYSVNAYFTYNPRLLTRTNERLPLLPAVDWSFIIGGLMSLMAVLLSFNAICGEKRGGTLRYVLSNPISRLTIFLGKFIGLAAVMFLVLGIGIIVNLLVIMAMGSITITGEVLSNIVFTGALSFLYLTFFIFLGLAVSSMTSRPAVSLVVLLIFWILIVVAVPGLSRLVAEQQSSVTNSFDHQRSRDAAVDQVRANHPSEAGNWHGNPHDPWIPLRAKLVTDMVKTNQRFEDEYLSEKINQIELLNTYSSISPLGLLNDALERFTGTGITGLKQFRESCRRYQNILYNFTKSRDAVDPESPHLLYAWWGNGTDRGTTSTNPVDMGSVPRYREIASAIGFPGNASNWPVHHTLILIILNIAAAMAGFLVFARYDPR